jgi:hypothetical protein
MLQKSQPKTLKTIKGLTVAITGRCWKIRPDLAALIRKAGGRVTSSYSVTRSTDVLVRGASESWAFGTYGEKEDAAARLIQAGQQLFVVDDYEFEKLIEKARPARLSTVLAGQPTEWFRPVRNDKAFIRSCNIAGPLDREYTARGRVEQAYLRSKLFNRAVKAKCALCGDVFPTDLLIAAHIKPRSECALSERRDASHVVFPLCLLGCDSLYERGFVSVGPEGRAVTSSRDLPSSVRNHLKRISGRKCLSWKKNSSAYFLWHHDRRFRH